MAEGEDKAEGEFATAGYAGPTVPEPALDPLLLGAHGGTKLHLIVKVKVGTGFSRRTLESLFQHFQSLIRRNPSLVDPAQEPGVTYLAPRLVA